MCKQVLGKYKNVSKICNITGELFFSMVCHCVISKTLPIMNLVATPIGNPKDLTLGTNFCKCEMVWIKDFCVMYSKHILKL